MVTTTRSARGAILVAILAGAHLVPAAAQVAEADADSIRARMYRGTITVFAPGADGDVPPERVLKGRALGTPWPGTLAVDANGYLYTTAAPRTGDDTIRVFAPHADGEARPVRTLAGPRSRISNPTGLALDDFGRLYVGVDHGRSAPSQYAVVVHAAGARGDPAPLREILGAGHRLERMAGPDRLAVGRGDSLYVRSVAVLAVYAPGARGGTEPVRLIYRRVPGRQFARIHAPELFALDPHDTLYSVSKDTVMVYAPGGYDEGTPVRTIAGPQTGLRGIADIAVDRGGTLYVTMAGPRWDKSLVAVFAPGADGDVAPVRTITGGRTRLSMPSHLAVGPDGRVYVANRGDPGTVEAGP